MLEPLLLNESVSGIAGWLEDKSFNLAPHKTKLTLLVTTRSVQKINVVVEGVDISSRRSVKYLDVYFDRNMAMD